MRVPRVVAFFLLGVFLGVATSVISGSTYDGAFLGAFFAGAATRTRPVLGFLMGLAVGLTLDLSARFILMSIGAHAHLWTGAPSSVDAFTLALAIAAGGIGSYTWRHVVKARRGSEVH
jgi:hypothetical protein